MNFYLTGLSAFILGLIVDRFLPSYFSKKGENLATKEDVGKITIEIEKVKNIFKDQYDLSRAEREFYGRMIETIYRFSAEIKKYEFENKQLASGDVFLTNQALKKKLFEFKDLANEFVGKSYVFLKEENYLNLKKALDTTSTFADLTNNLLDAMRKSLYPDTKLSPQSGDLKEFKY